MLAPHLIENSTAAVEQIKEDISGTVMQKYTLLLKWFQGAGHTATFRNLFSLMQQEGTSVTIDCDSIAKYLKIKPEDIRACK